MPSDNPEFNRKWVEEFEKTLEENTSNTKYCNCCGAKKIDGVGECYTDCMWYDGPLPHDANPH